MGKRFVLILGTAFAVLGLALWLKFGASADLFWLLSREGAFLLPLVAGSALIDSLNPCAFSILLLTIAFLFSLGRLRRSVLRIGLLYILGIFLAYLAIGLGILQVLHLFSVPHFMAKVGAILLAVFGLINIGEALSPRFPIKLHVPHAAHRRMADLIERASAPAALALGGLVGLCEFPCTGGPYLAVLGLLHDQTTFGQGLAYLLLYNLIFVLPLALILLVVSEETVVGRLRKWQARMRGKERLLAGILMVVLAILILGIS